MSKYFHSHLRSQRGIASLLTVLVLLISLTLVTMLTSKTVLVEMKLAADNYRSSQASGAANAAINFGAQYFASGLDQNNDGTVDTVADLSLTHGGQTTSASLSFNNNDARCTTDTDMKSALVTSSGLSDDNSASRTIIQCLGTVYLLKGSGPKQPLVGKSNIALTGSAQIINRYTDVTVWSGNSSGITGSAMITYIRPPDITLTSLTESERDDATTTPSISNAQKASSNTLGNGADVIDNDPNLGSLSSDDFFDQFFVHDKPKIKALAYSEDQYFPNGASESDLDDLTNLIWVTGNVSITSTGISIGTSANPAILIIDGDLTLNGGTIIGMLYVTGTFTVSGGATIIGSAISESPVSGNGALTLVYSPNFGAGSSSTGSNSNEKSVLVNGSWRDW